MILLELRFEAAEERESISSGTGKAGENSILVQPPNFSSCVLDDSFAQRDLAVCGHHNFAVATHTEHGGRANSRGFSRLRIRGIGAL